MVGFLQTPWGHWKTARRGASARPSRHLGQLGLLLAAACLWSGCASRPFVAAQVADLMAAGMDSYEQEPDLALLKDAFPAHIKLLEAVAQSDPENPGLNLLLSRLYGGYGFAFIELEIENLRLGAPAAGGLRRPETAELDALRKRADRFYRRGADYALSALEHRHPKFAARMAAIDSRDKALTDLEHADVPALFWYAFNLGRRIDLNRKDLRLIAQAYLAEKAMQRVVALEPGYYHGAAHLFLMVYYAKHPARAAGPDPVVESHYRAVGDLPDGARMAADVFYAAEVLARGSDRQTFTALLESVIDTGDLGAGCLLDRVALARAPALKAAADRIFDQGKVP